MKDHTETQLRGRIRFLLLSFTVALVLSGITAFPLEWELSLLSAWTQHAPADLKDWIDRVYVALREINSRYPFIAYGTDWLAFAHIVIAIGFIGPLRDPARNLWVVELGMIACVLVIPVALVFGAIRGIPFYWRLIDCAFGVVGIVPLWLVRRDIGRLEAAQKP